MPQPAVRVENLGKRFEIGQIGTATDVLRSARKLKRRLTRTRPEDLDPDRPWRHDEAANAFWALTGIDFEVPEGEVLGIIGGNGAGKSTLLKILSRITAPTTGKIELYGRVGALLEVGTGFNAELTGRENMYLNAAILGMNKREVDKKFDDIIQFAGVEKFIDTPVKRYSSGMKVRLGFAVAAHLEPEILIIDEVLAVGDIEFQKRCLGKMREVATDGRTVLFVSHKMGSIEQLCDRAILLDQGRVADDGEPSKVIHEYARVQSAKYSRQEGAVNRYSEADVYLVDADLLDADGNSTDMVRYGEPFGFCFHWKHERTESVPVYNVQIRDDFDELLCAANTKMWGGLESVQRGVNYVECWFHDNVLLPGTYRISAGVYDGGSHMRQRADKCVELVISDLAWDLDYPFTTIHNAKMAPRYSWTLASGRGVVPTGREAY